MFPGIIVLVAATVLVLRGSPRLGHMPDADMRKDAYAMRDAELWARDNTPTGSLFMPDPGMPDAWRGKSHRPSFGVAREWLLYSLLYNSSSGALNEGLARYRALGLEAPPPYIFDKDQNRMLPLVRRITSEAQQKYYAFTAADFDRFTSTYGVRYFIFQRKMMKGPAPLDVVFENSHYLIAKANGVK